MSLVHFSEKKHRRKRLLRCTIPLLLKIISVKMKALKSLSLVLLAVSLLLMVSSCNQPCKGYCVAYADEFVIDSYKIKQGKLSILEMEGTELGELPENALEEYKDTIAEDDILNIAIYHPTRKDLMESIQFINNAIGFRVYQGKVDIPDIQSVEVEGLTLDEARLKLQNIFRRQIKDIEVFISYKDRLARKVELTGMVQTPYIPVDGKIRLYEILALAHVPSEANFFKSYVIRDCQQLPVDLHKLMQEGDMCQNIVMRGGDKVYIASPEDARAMVMGEVLRPVPVPLPYGYMSLREALVIAGGIPYTGNRNCIQVIRGNIVNPKIYVLAWEHIVNLPNDSLLLMPGDTVYVSEKPITEWNRFISQLFPSFTGIQQGVGTYNLLIP